ncbi:OmpA family protein [Flavobacterium hydatis]|uniref:Flagellar motor protein MotB n=1 Tax=Flavobacterium hydatis TaxID=991 RepID=A0A085ZB20_FLAHY|nr:OmpA family protein [Flavobacterium hydatis]KFF01634.1 flagellar motor protein MotB [Flavobacterium hydatis]OXA92648.1 flagellar motor protein MotB [Flavobacterium hydatis]
MKIKTLLYSTILSILALQSYGQKAAIDAANKKYERYAYVDAIITYERIAEKGYKDEKMFQKLGNAYYFNAELPQAEKWYSELFAMNQNQEPEYYYRYSQALKSIGNYSKADKMLEEFNKKSGNDLRAKSYDNNKNYLEKIKANSGRFDIADANINSIYSDYGSSFLDNKLVFASARDTGGISKKVFKWTNQSFTDLYTAEIKAGGEMGKPELFSKKINSKFHESTPVFTKDGQTMYFTRNNYLGHKKGKDSKEVTLLKLYKAILKDNEWSNITELPFNSNNYSVAHPALSLDEKTLYFASDMPGTLGQSDLFSVTINSDGSYGVPMNLGKTINTEGKETFPFISGDNELYFASDGHQGLGGLDVFVSKMRNDNSFGEVQNVGAPINSSQDDFAFLIDSKNRNGFFTSNRSGGKGYDDIYRFLERRKLTCEQLLSGIITDKETGAVLAGSKVSLFNDKLELITTITTNLKGKYEFDVECGKVYSVRAEKEEYETKEEKIVIRNITGKTELPLQLEQRIKPIGVGTDLAKTLDIPIIYFDLDKSFIRKEAAFELEKILAVMQQYPKMKIDVRSHTDSRQTAKYNIALSDRRAKSTIAWLVKNGISSDRLTGKGYGESQLVNHCSDGVKCSEQEHQANRRSEFVIISIE